MGSPGVDAKVAPLVPGHETAITTLDLYGHLSPDKLDELADRLDDAVCGPGANPEPTDDGEVGDQ